MGILITLLVTCHAPLKIPKLAQNLGWVEQSERLSPTLKTVCQSEVRWQSMSFSKARFISYVVRDFRAVMQDMDFPCIVQI